MQKLPFRFSAAMLLPAVLFAACLVFTSAASLGQSAKAKPQKLRVLFITGEDHPAHLWREIGPVLRNTLNADAAVDCRIAEDLEFLATDVVNDYNVILFYFKNYAPLKRNDRAKKNLMEFVENGGGLGLIHFSCGAFEDWKEFEQFAGRVWEPKKRAHDPYGKFTVHYVDSEHSITKGLSDFEITDELYTCLRDSQEPIHVLAQAVSKVDNKPYPMVFVLEKGKGRIFHTTLGHDVKAVSSDGFKNLLPRAVLWLGKQ
ncbi:MAG: ThuA domain-containing protein [Planctomycetaceae bacterium]|jgi:type 1 glutamine amidotransferase|nr:ThuA domain-containing protein [Planctomycetaceae bacterium]